MKKIIKGALIIFTSFCMMSCNSMNNQDAGTLTGALAGGLIGSTIGQGSGQMMAIAAGAVVGGMIGGSIGRDMDRNDRMRMNAALERNAIGEPEYWHNSRNDIDYEVVPVRNVRVRGNSYCREYRTIAYIGGRKREVYGTACRQPDGAWRAVR